MILLADISKIYLMFVTGLEIDIEQFKRTRNRSIGFGFATFAVPLLGGILVGRIFGFGWNTAVLIGSLLASHTLLAYPIVKRLGVVNDEAVTVTIGATIFTDIGSLFVLAIRLGVNKGDFTIIDLGILLGSLIVYTLIVLLGLERCFANASHFAIAEPLITSRAAAQLSSEDLKESEATASNSAIDVQPERTRVVVPVYNPQTERYLLELTSLLTKKDRGEIIPLAIAKAESRLDSLELNVDVARCQKLLTQAQEIGEELGITTKPELRIEYDIAHGISHASREVNANSIVLGFNNLNSSRFFNSVTDSVLWSAHCSVVVARLLDSSLKIKRILLPEVTLLHVCPSGTSKERKTNIHYQLTTVAQHFLSAATVDIRVTAQNNFVREILEASRTHELVILRSQRQRVGVNSLALGATTRPLLQNLNCSIILLGEL